MAIKIKGTVGSVSVDLEIEGITEELISSLGKIIKKNDVCSFDSNTDKEENASGDSDSNSDLKIQSVFGGALIEEATEYIREQGEVSSGDLINYLSGKGCSDSEIKRTMMLLREASGVKTKQGPDFQRMYMLN